MLRFMICSNVGILVMMSECHIMELKLNYSLDACLLGRSDEKFIGILLDGIIPSSTDNSYSSDKKVHTLDRY